ncbi:MAG: hypothetical protein AAF741_14130 [Bacteroidota bacterium]
MNFTIDDKQYNLRFSFLSLKKITAQLGEDQLAKIEEIATRISFANVATLIQICIAADLRKSKSKQKPPSTEAIEEAFDLEENEGALAQFVNALMTAFGRHLGVADEAEDLQKAVDEGN